MAFNLEALDVGNQRPIRHTDRIDHVTPVHPHVGQDPFISDRRHELGYDTGTSTTDQDRVVDGAADETHPHLLEVQGE